jgi:hypothetical protein
MVCDRARRRHRLQTQTNHTLTPFSLVPNNPSPFEGGGIIGRTRDTGNRRWHWVRLIGSARIRTMFCAFTLSGTWWIWVSAHTLIYCCCPPLSRHSPLVGLHCSTAVAGAGAAPVVPPRDGKYWRANTGDRVTTHMIRFEREGSEVCLREEEICVCVHEQEQAHVWCLKCMCAEVQ